jgi:hypothetical protein
VDCASERTGASQLLGCRDAVPSFGALHRGQAAPAPPHVQACSPSHGLSGGFSQTQPCNGTGYPVLMQPVRPGRKIYPAPSKKCGGKGGIEGPPTEAALVIIFWRIRNRIVG